MQDNSLTSIKLIQRLHNLAVESEIYDLADRYTISVMDGKISSFYLPIQPDRFQDVIKAFEPYEVTSFAGCPAIKVTWFGVLVQVWEFHPTTDLSLIGAA